MRFFVFSPFFSFCLLFFPLLFLCSLCVIVFLFSALSLSFFFFLLLLHPLSLLGHMEVVRLLVSHGAEVVCKDKKGYTPLHAAASSGMIGVVKYLLDLGVEVRLPLPQNCHIAPPHP